MKRAARSGLISLVIAVALSPLAFACVQVTPTAEPTSTPGPTALDILGWLDSPADVPHWIAWSAVRRMVSEDEPLSRQVASLDWVADGITAEEAGALDDLSWLLYENPAVVEMALSLRWMATDGTITPNRRSALRAIRAAAVADENVGVALAEYTWLTDGVTDDEAEALGTLADIVAPDFVSRTATGIGAMRPDRSGIGKPPAISAATREFATTLSEFDWMQDDVTSLESEFIASLTEMADEAGSIHADAVKIVTSYDWITDGIDGRETVPVRRLGILFEAADAEDEAALHTILGYDWIAPGMYPIELRALGRFADLLHANSSNDADVIQTMLSYQWMDDPIDSAAYNLLPEFSRLLRVDEPEGESYRQALLNYRWLADDVNGDEGAGFRLLASSLESLLPDHSAALDALLAYDWLRDDLRSDEIAPIQALSGIAEQYDDTSSEFIAALITRPWLRDGVTGNEVALLQDFQEYLAFYRVPATDVPSRLATYPWLDDGVSGLELWYLEGALDLLRDVSPTAPETAAAIIENADADPDSLESELSALNGLTHAVSESASLYGSDLTRDITGMPLLPDGISRLEGRWLHEYAVLLEELSGRNEDVARSLLALPWARDGISAHEREWTHQYRRLLEETEGRARQNAISLRNLSWFQEQINLREATMMGRLALAALHDDPRLTRIIDADWSPDGISQSDLNRLVELLDLL